jgi:hypothetical protein
MRIRPEQLYTQARPPGRLGRIVQFPLARIPIALLFLVPVLALNKGFRAVVYPHLGGNAEVIARYVEAGIFLALFIAAYRGRLASSTAGSDRAGAVCD